MALLPGANLKRLSFTRPQNRNNPISLIKMKTFVKKFQAQEAKI
jgi:hypothetical protein